MRIYGIDFTCAPKEGNPIACIRCNFENGKLSLLDFMPFENWEKFESFLTQKGPWIAGIDFPFGQPRKLIENLKWPNNWLEYVSLIFKKGKDWFENTLTEYKKDRPYGDKEHRRATDQKAQSFSPMKLGRPAVGKMFFQGAPRIMKSGASILPFLKTLNNKIIVEGYPALVARKLIGREGYKGNAPDRINRREDIVKKLKSDETLIRKEYGFTINFNKIETNSLIYESTADKIDAILCGIQATWSYSQRSNNYGIPEYCDKLEGWIVDPFMLKD